MRIKTNRIFVATSVIFIALFLLCEAAWAGESATEQAIREELIRLGGSESPHKKQEVKLTEATVNILPFEIPKQFEKTTDTYPESVTNITIKNGTYYRGDKPVFLIGVESSGYEGTWLCKMLGIDVQPVHNRVKAGYRAALKVTESKGPDGRPMLTVDCDSPDPYGDARVREILLGGTQTWFDYHLTMSSWYPLPYLKYRFDPPFYTPHLDGWRKTSSHFLDVNMDNPQARQHYVNMMRWGSRYIRKYPVLFHELVNEVSYINPNPTNVKKFQDAMVTKFETIENANAAWGTKFESFSKIMPPVNVSSAGIYNSEWGVIPHGKDLSNNLWVDWIKFMQQVAEEMFKDLVSEYKATNPDALCTFQTPYYSGTHAQTPAMWNRIVDTYGQERGLRLIKVEAGKESWDSVRGMLGQALCSDIVDKALPDKPSFNQEPVCVGYPRDKYIIGPAGMRSFFWNQAVHGAAGSLISYYYSQGTSGGGRSTFDPRSMQLTALKEMPRVRNEINNVGQLVLPRPRIKARAAMMYSYESARPLRPEDKKGRHRRWMGEVCDIYGPALFSGVPLAVIDNDMLLNDDLSAYKVLILARAFRVKPGTLDALQRYVSGGGVLVVTSDGLRIDDDTHKPLDASQLLGGKVGQPVTAKQKITFGDLGIDPCETAAVLASPLDGADDFSVELHGFAFTPKSAEVLATTGEGDAALTVNTVGLGKVYYMAREFDGPGKCHLMQWIMSQAGQTPDVEAELTDELTTNYVETHLFSTDMHHVVYAMNWGGGPREARLKVRADVMGDEFFVRNLRTLKYIKPDGTEGKTTWTTADLQQGIPCQLPMHDPMVFVIDWAETDPLELADLSEEHKDVLDWMWRVSPDSENRVLLDVMYSTEGRLHGYKMPTAAKLLEDSGFKVEYLVSPLSKMKVRTGEDVRDGKLSDFNIYIIPGSFGGREFPEADRVAIKEFVENGGGLLFCSVRNWHGGPNKNNLVLEQFGMEVPFTYIYDEQNALHDEPLWFTANDITEHAISQGVSQVYVMGARPVVGGQAVVSTGPGTYTEHPWFEGEPWNQKRKDGPVAVVAAAEFGKGRVVAIGSDYLFRPDDLEKCDNKKLFENIIEWLAEPTAAQAGPKRNFSSYNTLPEVPPAEPLKTVAQLWTFEEEAEFKAGTVVSGLAYTGKKCIRADNVDGSSYDALVSTEWAGDGWCVIPKDPHLNFAYYTLFPCSVTLLFEASEQPAKFRTELAELGKWTFVSLPVSQFEGSENLTGQPLANIMIKLGESGTQMEVYIDDLSVSEGPLAPPRED